MLNTRNKIFYILLACLLLLSGGSTFAQKATVRVTIEPSEILIGEQAVINLEVIAPKGRQIQFPTFQDTLITGIEVLAMLPTDTTMTEVMKLNQKYIVTSFDSTLYHIDYLRIVDGTDTLRSNDFGLKVSAPQLSDSTLAYLEKLRKGETDSIDFQKLEIKEPYADKVLSPPFVWQDYLDYLLIAAAVLLIGILLLVGLILYLNKRRKGYYFKPKVIIPPHIIALTQLEKLKEKHLCQQGMEKEYYTQISDIVRNYIDQRYHINAPEMISDHIIEAVHRVTDTKSATENLSQILSLSDLVKFAKYIPLPNENDLTLVNAMLFVNQTKLEEQPKTDENGRPVKEGSDEGKLESKKETTNNNEANSKKI